MRRPRGTLLRFLLTYLTVLGLVIASGIVLSTLSSRRIEESVLRANTALLGQAEQVVEEKLQEASLLVFQLASTQSTKDLVYSTREDVTHYRSALEVQRNIAYLLKANILVNDICVFSTHSGMVVSSHAYFDTLTFFGNYLTHPDIPYNRWIQEILPSGHFGTYLPGATVPVQEIPRACVVVVWTLPIGIPGAYDGALLVLLDSTKLCSLVSHVPLESGGAFGVFDERGTPIILQTVSSPRFAVDRYDLLALTGREPQLLVARVTSERGWTYLTVLPRAAVLSPVTGFQRISWILIAATLVVGLGASFTMARRLSTPIEHVIEMLDGTPGGSGEAPAHSHGFLEDAVSRLIAANRKLDLTVGEYMPLLRQAFFDRLLKYGFATPEELERHRSKIGMRIEGDRFVVLLVHSTDAADIGGRSQYAAYRAARKAMMNAVASTFDNAIWVQACDTATHAVLLSWRGDSEEELRRAVTKGCHQLWEALPARTRSRYRIAVGGFCDSLEEVRISYREASEAISVMNLASGSPVVWADAVHAERRSHAYSLALEQRLMRHVLAGNKAEVERMLGTFYQASIANEPISYPMLQVLRYELIGTVIRIVQEAGLRTRLDAIMCRMEQESTTERFFAEVLAQLLAICDAVAKDAHTGETEARQRIVDLVRRNLGNANLTIDMLSEMAGIPPGHIQRCLRKVTGLSFARYLENLRVENAQHALATTRQSVQSVASAAGYASDKSFRRAFRRVTGKSPADYRVASNRRSMTTQPDGRSSAAPPLPG